MGGADMEEKFLINENEDQDATESTEKMIIYDTGRRFDIVLDIEKVNTDQSIGE